MDEEQEEQKEDEEDTGLYEELGELAPPPPAGQKSQPTVPPPSFDLRNKFKVSLAADDDYEDLSCDQRAVAIYDYVGGERPVHPVTPPPNHHLLVSVDQTLPSSAPLRG